MKLSAILFCAALAGVASLGCMDKPSTDEELAEALAQRSAEPRGPKPLPVPGAMPLLAVVAGQGAGPIRLGANVSQVERLMQHPCEVRSENLCRYVQYGVDFNLVGGITQSIYIQRHGRPAGKDANNNDIEFGFFQGMIPPDLRLGMLPQAIEEYLGKPYRAERVAGPNPQNMVYRHYYPGITLEYDFWPETGKLLLGGIRIYKDPNAVAQGAADAGAASDAGAPAPAASDAAPAASDAGAPPHEVGKKKAAAHDAGAPRVREPEPR
ncbi:MAG TPA: hypothetical protein VF103_00890 [Polyangiaceae bacterium]